MWLSVESAGGLTANGPHGLQYIRNLRVRHARAVPVTRMSALVVTLL